MTKGTVRYLIGITTVATAFLSVLIGLTLYGLVTRASTVGAQQRALFNTNRTVNNDVMFELLQMAGTTAQIHEQGFARSTASHIRTNNHGSLPSIFLFEDVESFSLVHITFAGGGSPIFTFMMDAPYGRTDTQENIHEQINDDFEQTLEVFSFMRSAIVTPCDPRILWQRFHTEADDFTNYDFGSKMWLPSLYEVDTFFELNVSELVTPDGMWLRTESRYIRDDGALRQRNINSEGALGIRPFIHISLQCFANPIIEANIFSNSPNASVNFGNNYGHERTVTTMIGDGVARLNFNAGRGYTIARENISVFGTADYRIIDTLDTYKQIVSIELTDIDPRHSTFGGRLVVDVTAQLKQFSITSYCGLFPATTFNVHSQEVSLQPLTSAPAGYSFAHWSLSEGGLPIHSIPSGTARNIELFAVFVETTIPDTNNVVATPAPAPQPFAVQFDYGIDGRPSRWETFNFYPGQPLRYAMYVPTPSPSIASTMRFGGWYLDEGFNLPFFHSIAPNLGAGVVDVTLFARWIPITHYSVIFDPMGGTSVPSSIQTITERPTRPTNPVRIGHTFAGWETFIDTEWVPFNFSVNHTETVIARAMWEENIWRLSYNLGGGRFLDSHPLTTQLTFATPFVSPIVDPVREGFVFAGWYTSPAFTTEFQFPTVLVNGQPRRQAIMPDDNLTIFARWVPCTNSIVSLLAIMEAEFANQRFYTATSFHAFQTTVNTARSVINRGATTAQIATQRTLLEQAYANLTMNPSELMALLTNPRFPSTNAVFEPSQGTWAQFVAYRVAVENARVFLASGVRDVNALRMHYENIRNTIRVIDNGRFGLSDSDAGGDRDETAVGGTNVGGGNPFVVFVDRSELLSLILYIEHRPEFSQTFDELVALLDNRIVSQQAVNTRVRQAIEVLGLAEQITTNTANLALGTFTGASAIRYANARNNVLAILDDKESTFFDYEAAMRAYNNARAGLVSASRLDTFEESGNTSAIAISVTIAIVIATIGITALVLLRKNKELVVISDED
ncbi:MAG: InlB B-repeat-containing protein [Firmicutes bacterium]|nr:InlB B-repeat-containing protein [Bacillota bacterium]